MPTYEYECTKCGHRFERFQSITAPALKRCPECRCKLRRLIGAGAVIIFKGSGFHATDYRSSEYKDREKSESGKKEEKKPAGGAAPEKKDSKKEGSGDGNK